MRTADIKQRVLASFEATGHHVVPSAPLPRSGDPDQLFVDAGVVPLVPHLLGNGVPPYQRVASAQKCLSTRGRGAVTATDGPVAAAVQATAEQAAAEHATFFQVCGGFAFGDHSLSEAGSGAWGLVTGSVDDGGLGLDGDRIWATVGVDDEATFDVLHRIIGLPAERIVRRGGSASLWSLDRPGPCGPGSSLYFDRWPELGSAGEPELGTRRYPKLMTLAAVRHRRGAAIGGQDAPILGELPVHGVGTWFGLERLAAVSQGVGNLYEIDEIRPILDRAAELTGRPRAAGCRLPGTIADSSPGSPSASASASDSDEARLQVVADRVRAALMLIADGVTPSNAGRGHVLREVLREALLTMRLLGCHEPSMPALLPVALDCMSASYPQLTAEFDRIAGYAYGAEEAFRTSLRAATAVLDTAIAETKQASGTSLGAGQLFDLHETYGFPIDLTLEIAAEHGLDVDEAGFRQLVEDGGEREGRAAEEDHGPTGVRDHGGYRAVLASAGPVEFTGYVEVASESRIRAVLGPNGLPMTAVGQGQPAELVLDATPFYAEAGGQLSDTGRIVVGDGVFEVSDVRQVLPGLVVHTGTVLLGEIRTGVEAYGEIDILRRRAISRAHTATHMIHRAIQDRIGSNATQAGSRVAPGRLRFDFNVAHPADSSVLHEVEQQVNEVLLDDLAVRAYYTTIERARQLGAVALFGEKYGDQVRVVEVGDYAMEVCCGTHAARSGQVGLVKIISDSSVGSGVRRLDALVGLDAFNHLAREHLLVGRLSGLLRVPSDRIVDRVEETVAQLRAAERDLQRLRTQAVLASAAALAQAVTSVGQVDLVAVEAPAECSTAEARALATEVHGQMRPDHPGVVALALRSEGKASLVVSVNDAATGRGIAADALLQRVLAGRGGGNAQFAQGGGTGAEQLPAMLDAVQKALTTTC